MRRSQAFEGEYEADERTRAVVPSAPRTARITKAPSYDDQFEDRTQSARDSHIALGGLARASFVAPAEIEGERSPAIRARRQSFVDASEMLPALPAPPARPSARPSMRPGSRHSYVASSERNDFASSADDDEVTNYREDPRSALQPVRQPVRESTYAPAIESSEIEEVAVAAVAPPTTSRRARSKRPSSPASEERSRPLDYEALKRYLFDEVPPTGSFAEERASMETPVAPILDPRGTAKAFRPAMHSIRPEMLPPGMASTPAPVRGEIHPAARISHHALARASQHALAASQPDARASHHAFRPPMTTGPFLPDARASHHAFRPQQHQAAPDARASHHAFRPPMTTGPFLPTSPMSARPQMTVMNGPAAHAQHQHQHPMHAQPQSDSHVDGSWIVPTPRYPSTMPQLREPEATGFKVTLSFIAAAITAALALTVMIGAIVFIRSEDTPTSAVATTPIAETPVAATPIAAIPAIPAAVTTTDAVTPEPVVVATPVHETPAPIAHDKVVVKSAIVAAKPAVAKKKPVVVAQADEDDEDDAPPPPPKKKASSAKDKDVERMLAELQEQQLQR